MSDKKEKNNLDLSFLDGVDDFLENEAPSEKSLKQSQAQKLRHLAMTPAEKAQFKKTLQNAVAQFESKEQADEIFWKCWDENRGEKLYQALSEEYNVPYHSISDLVHPRTSANAKSFSGEKVHFMCPVDFDTLTQMQIDHKLKYSNVYKIRTKGFELLSEYDKIYLAGGSNAKVDGWRKHFPPSFVFHCRFRMGDQTPESIRDYCESLGKPKPRNDLAIYKHILYGNWTYGVDWFGWMEDISSIEVEFTNLKDALEWTNNYIGEEYYKDYTHIEQCWSKRMLWRTQTHGKPLLTAGWVFDRFNYKGERL